MSWASFKVDVLHANFAFFMKIFKTLYYYGLDELFTSSAFKDDQPCLCLATIAMWTRWCLCLGPGARILAALRKFRANFYQIWAAFNRQSDLLSLSTPTNWRICKTVLHPLMDRLRGRRLKRSLGAPIDALFSEFNETPIASKMAAAAFCAAEKPRRQCRMEQWSRCCALAFRR